jgi:HlyD family secretion protein
MSDSERSGRGVLKWLVTLIVLGAIGVGIYGFWSAEDNTGVTLNTATVDRGVLRQTISATGTLNPLLNVEVGSQVSGIIDEIFVDFNSEVQRGQVLARIETSTFEANVRQAEGEVASARAALELAEVELGRLHQLRDRELVPQSEVDTAVARLRQAEAMLNIRQHALERAQSELARCTIYSPVDGMVISRNVDVGQTVAASMTAPILFRIANDLSRMQINSLVPEADIGNIRDGQRVEFTVDAFPGETFDGVVVQVRNQPIIEQNVVTYDTVIEVANPDRKLKPGMTATVTIILDERQDILRVRNTALRARLPDSIRPPDPEPDASGGEGAARTVYRLRGGSVDSADLEAVIVYTGVTDGVYSEVYSGVRDGDVLATGVDLSAPATGGGRGSSLFGPAPAQF